MRPLLLAMLLLAAACGSVRLGEEQPGDEPPGDAEPGDQQTDSDPVGAAIDARVAQLSVVVTVSVPDARCNSCVELIADGSLGTPPYTFDWGDGMRARSRRVCAPFQNGPLTVTARDAAGRSSPPHELRLDLPSRICADAGVAEDAAAPVAGELCLQNPSFEGTPIVNAGGLFAASPWNDCTNPSRYNTPDILDQSSSTLLVTFPDPTDGKTYLRLREGVQTSQTLCAPVPAGARRSFLIDAQKLDLGLAALGDDEAMFLSVWGGLSKSCTVSEGFWLSPKLTTRWQTFCVTIEPQSDIDQLTLKAVSEDTSTTISYLLADHIVPVASCP